MKRKDAPDEVKVLAGLAVSAAAGYDHIEAEMLRRKLSAMNDEFNAWKRVAGSLSGGDLLGAATPVWSPSAASDD